MGKYKLTQYPANKSITILTGDQQYVRENVVGNEGIVCVKCGFSQHESNFRFHVKPTQNDAGRRDKTCKDCRLKAAGVKEIGKLRFSTAILAKGFRRCSVCKIIKPITDFHHNKKSYGGYANNCSECSYSLHALYFEKVYVPVAKQVKHKLDGNEFITSISFAKYIESKYKIEVAAVLKRVEMGYSDNDCIRTEYDLKSSKRSEGIIRVTNTVTNEVLKFRSYNDPELLRMFSKSTVLDLMKSGKPSKVIKSSKYQYPCIIQRLPKV